MRVRELDLPGVYMLEPRIFTDARGFFMELWHATRYQQARIPRAFVQDNYSHSTRGVLRGLHYQLNHPQGKLVSVFSGEVFDVAVDIRCGSPTFGQWVGVRLSGQNHRQLYIPPGFAHGFCVLSSTADFLYKCTDFYTPEDEYGLRWDDPHLAITWPLTTPLLSARDAAYPTLDTIPPEYLPVFGGDR
jgi:dTDP-4-dehydrorhamnose 3,5-epimerase